MQTTIYLIRHGAVAHKKDEKGRKLIYGPDIGLSHEGESTVHKLGQNFKQFGVGFSTLYTSPYTRAVDSAKILLPYVGSPRLIEEEGLNDLFVPGWVGRPMEELIKLRESGEEAPLYSPDDETQEQMIQRI